MKAGQSIPEGLVCPKGKRNELYAALSCAGQWVTEAIAVESDTTTTRNDSIFQASASCLAYQARLFRACLMIGNKGNS